MTERSFECAIVIGQAVRLQTQPPCKCPGKASGVYRGPYLLVFAMGYLNSMKAKIFSGFYILRPGFIFNHFSEMLREL